MAENTQRLSGRSPSALLNQLGQGGSPEQQFEQLKQYYAADAQYARQQLGHAQRELAPMQAALDKLKAKDDAGSRYVANSLELMVLVHESTVRLMTLQAECAEANTKALQAAGPQGDFKLKLAHEQPEFLEYYHLRNLSMGSFLAGQYPDGIDIVARAANGAPLMPEASPQEATARQAAADALRAASEADDELAKQLRYLGEEFAGLMALLEWGQITWRRASKAAPADKLQLLQDADWDKFNGKVQLLQELPNRVAAQPELAKLFPAP